MKNEVRQVMTGSIPIPAQEATAKIDTIPRILCGTYPTPLEEMVRLRELLGAGCPRLFIKRDDYTGTGFGSNKLRKLDYAMARELERGTTAVVTIAGERSNHARVTAAVCAKLGLRCLLVLNKATDDLYPEGLVPASRFVYELFGAELRWVGSREEREPAALDLVEELQAAGEKASYLPLGVSFPLGALGFVRAVREVMDQFAKLDVYPSHIFHASTSGGTQAGMIVGCELFGKTKVKIVGVSPDDPSEDVSKRVSEIANGICKLLGAPVSDIRVDEVNVLDGFIGPGYGIETTESKDALQLLARTEGIILDPTYTAKTMAALLDWIAKANLTESDTVLFWHTGGQLASFYSPSDRNGSN